MQQLQHESPTQHEPPTQHESLVPPWRDALVVLLVTLAAAVGCTQLDISEVLRGWTAPWERLQLDELVPIVLVLAFALAWFAARRYHDARHELRRRYHAERQLAAALADNRRLSQQYVRSQEAERKSLARELHDELGQYLNVIELDAVGVRDEHLDEGTLRKRADAIVQHCKHIHGALAGLIRQLRPVGLDELGLTAALEHCLDTWRPRMPGAQLRLLADGEFADLPETVAVTVYRVVQEALTNAAKHAAPADVTVMLERGNDPRADQVLVTVRDDGVGTALGAPTAGLGLIGMRERVAALSGSFELVSAPGRGFQLRACIPAT